MARYKRDIDWSTQGMDVDTTSFPAALAKIYTRYTDQRKKAAESKTDFEKALVLQLRQAGKLEPHKSLVFAYNFGKVRVVIVDATDEPVKAAAKNSLTFK